MDHQTEQNSSRNYSKKLRQKAVTSDNNNNHGRNYDQYFDAFKPDTQTCLTAVTIDNSVENDRKSDNEMHLNMLPTISEMRETIKYLSEKLTKLSAEFRQIQQNSVLNIGQNEVEDKELHLLTKFEAFKLPIGSRADLESLEFDLKSDKSFYVFFVSIAYMH